MVSITSKKILFSSKIPAMTVLLFFFLSLSIVSGVFSPPASGDIYKWKDKDGNWRYSDQPPPESQDDSWWEEEGRIIRTTPPKDTPEAKQSIQDPAEAEIRASGEGMLWKIEVQGPAPSYLLGTIHSEDPRVLNFSPSVERLFDKAETFIMEVVLNESSIFEASATMILTDGRSLKSIIGESLYERVTNAVDSYGITETAVNYMKPWAVMSILSIPMPETGQFMDVVLHRKALSQGKKIVGLESTSDQLNALDNMPVEDQIALLEDTLDYMDQFPDLFEKMIQTYLDGDLEGIVELGNTFMNPKNQEIMKKMMKRLNDERNFAMVNRMLPHLMAGNAFIAVGALHLPGPNGLLNLLSERGFKVTVAK